MNWPWRRKRKATHDAAVQAEQAAIKQLREAKQQRPVVRQVADDFTTSVEDALRARRRHA